MSLPKFRWLRLIKIILTGCLALFLVSIYTHKIEPIWFEVNPIAIALPNLDREFVGYKIVQISDLHVGDRLSKADLDRVVDLVNAQNPDLVVITGDHVSRLPRQHLELLASLSRLHPHDRVLSVMGNHDVHDDPTQVRAKLAQAGIKLLENTIYTLNRGHATLHVAGVGDVYFHQDKLDRVLDRLPSTGAAIMLAHEPDFADETAATGRFGLQLSGHSHGGQVRLPFFQGYVPSLAEKYPIGRYQVGKMIQYTNRGIGTVKLYARFNCRPEISVFTLG